MGDHIWVTGTGVQCTEHEVERFDFEFEHGYVEAQAPLCLRCFACKECDPDKPCKPVPERKTEDGERHD